MQLFIFIVCVTKKFRLEHLSEEQVNAGSIPALLKGLIAHKVWVVLQYFRVFAPR